MTTSADSSVYEYTMTRLEGTSQDLSDYEGKVILIVNVASKCGLTPQYEDLQALYQEYSEQGLVILGFPANNFMNQEPGSNEDIKAFCERNYGVSFPMFEKISVKGKDAHPLYQYLKAVTGEGPGWNFHKYLINRDGTQVVSISARSRVTDAKVRAQITSLL